MEKRTIKEILRAGKGAVGGEVEVSGWIRTTRLSKTFGFMEINDGSFFKNLQAVFDEGLANFADISRLPIGSAVRLEGRLVASPGKEQPLELKVSAARVIGRSDPDFPLQKKRHSFEFLRTIAHLRPRTNTFLAVFRVRSLLAQAIHRFFEERNFIYVHTPIVTGSDAEGAGQMFRVTTLDPSDPPRRPDRTVDYGQDFFGRETFLTVSGQLNVECFCMAYSGVYTFGPTFRAENSNTQRHASEFWMIEPEIAFAALPENMALAEALVKYLIDDVMAKLPEELEFFNRFVDTGLIARLELVRGSTFAHVSYGDAVEILKRSGREFQFKPQWGMDLQTEHERFLTEEHFKKPLFVTDYPKEIKAFYMRQNDDGRTVAAMDLLVPEVGEIIGGSQREERADMLERRIREMNLDLDHYRWYLDLRKYGGVPHAGFGLGFERAIMYLTGMQNIRDVIPFPRTPKNAEY